MCNSGNGDNVSVVLGNGNGTFGTVASFPFGGSSVQLRVADVNGDKLLDLLVVCPPFNNVGVYSGLGNGTFNASPLSTPTIGTGSRSVEVVDLDNDGLSDLVVTNPGDGTLIS